MGKRGGALWRRVTYQLPPPHQQQPQPQQPGMSAHSASSIPASTSLEGRVTVTDAAGASVSAALPLWDYLRTQLQLLSLDFSAQEARQLPHNFWGGFTGFLGYELKTGCGGAAAHAAATPDAALFFADQLLAVDHGAGDVFCLALHDASAPGTQVAADAWLGDTAQLISRLAAGSAGGAGAPQQPAANGAAPPPPAGACAQRCASPGCQGSGRAGAGTRGAPWRLHHSRQQYLAAIAACQAALHAGESYELCLTTALSRPAPDCTTFPWTFYRHLRAVNPAPYSAWLRFAAPGGSSGDQLAPGPLTVCCSSPERFLRADRCVGAEDLAGAARRRVSCACRREGWPIA
jgi:para-aminobenzoate synthetase